jgi:hypothetical protein
MITNNNIHNTLDNNKITNITIQLNSSNQLEDKNKQNINVTLRDLNLNAFITSFLDYKTSTIIEYLINETSFYLHCKIPNPLEPTDDEKIKVFKFMKNLSYYITYNLRFRNRILKVSFIYADSGAENTLNDNNVPIQNFTIYCSPSSYLPTITNLKQSFLGTLNF